MEIPFGLKRFGKAMRNLIADPLPRNKQLTLARFEQRGASIDFHYLVDGVDYVNTVTIPAEQAEPLRLQACPALDQLLTAIGLFLAGFFFRMSDFHGISVQCAPLDPESRAFFARYFQGGMGEFRYLQGLDPSRPIDIEAQEGGPITPFDYDAPQCVLLCNGGGKDTVVSGELLKAAGIPFIWFSMHLNPARQRVIDLSGVSESIAVDFDTDSRIEQRVAYAWGHVPRTPIASAIALLIAVLKRMPYVALGNEHSANEGNVRFKGAEVNHQYAKTFEFELGFARFIHRRVTRSATVFSVLRPFHDLQLAGMLAGRPRYFNAFVSCNRGIVHDQWCKACPKCAFTALALGAYVGREGLQQVFGEDIFRRVEIRRHVMDLLVNAVKPWECVGTRDECLVAIDMMLRSDPGWDFDRHPRREDFQAVLAREDMGRLRENVLSRASARHLIPAALLVSVNQGIAAFDRIKVQIPDAQAQ